MRLDFAAEMINLKNRWVKNYEQRRFSSEPDLLKPNPKALAHPCLVSG